MLKKRSLHTIHEDSSDLCFFTVIIKYVHCVGRKCELAQTFSSFMLYNVNDVRRIFHEKFRFRFYRVFFLRCIATLEFHQFHFLREKRSSNGFDEPSSTVIRNT